MKDLVNAINGTDVFENETQVDMDLIKEYHLRNERKKDDDKWLKQYKPMVIKGLHKLGKEKADFGDIRVSYVVPDQSRFDHDKVLEFALEKGLFDLITKPVLDEDALTVMIEQGLIDLEELKEHAWVESKGAARLSVKQVKKS